MSETGPRKSKEMTVSNSHQEQDTRMTIEQAIATLPGGTVKLWDPDHPGTYVLAPLPFWEVLGNGTYAYNPALAREALDACVAAGWLVEQPESATRERVTRVCKRSHRDDGRVIDALDFYGDGPQWSKFKMTTVYIDSNQDAADFEAASGLSVASLPRWEGDAALAPDATAAGKYLVPAAFSIALRDNPKYDPEAVPKRPKRLFAGYVGNASKAPQPAEQPEPEPQGQQQKTGSHPATLLIATVTHIRARRDRASGAVSFWLMAGVEEKFFHGVDSEQVARLLDMKALSPATLDAIGKKAQAAQTHWSDTRPLKGPVNVQYNKLDDTRSQVIAVLGPQA